ncbi:16S rRNA (cytosine(1402)-N(4))-methyltransferase RsmH [Corynebacterium sp.]|uniref:16S rRNA (cytosine(1402)-N(4))-methyltransferase RsmH n=1 Tax=Corynebacterium sp. TaxID=1720 RepID=UPI0026DAD61D|nr:16S rRNA (cytosine(1402)-N(4))-methyltransferase RsmH [Corynebacterium sp.]MDO4609117.1 16S rRNA (cytosine(1402)-N(4))-methyltransferase RsmH [Corynebacterium sp.]
MAARKNHMRHTGNSGTAGLSAGVPGDRRSGEHGHVPVMLHRMGDLAAPAVEAVAARGEVPVLVDATLGAGGHAEHFLERFGNAVLLGLDRDGAALAGARERLARFGDRFFGVQIRFDALGDVLDGTVDLGDDDHPVMAAARAHGIAAALFDLGVSSMQLDQADRGFAYRVDAPLDMRMDPTSGITAADVLNTYDRADIARILSVYGDERFAGKISSAIVREREREPFTTSARLVELLYGVIPAASRRTGGHPAKRTFQALRVEVNRELESLERALPVVLDRLAVGGRAIFMSYQSHEDRLVKRAFAERVKDTTPPGLPVPLPDREPRFRLVTRGAEKAAGAEVEENPRAAPVRVRCAERTRPD